MKMSHHVRMFLGNGLIVVVNKYAVISISFASLFNVHQISVKSRDDLFEGLFLDGSNISARVKVNLVYAFVRII